MKLATPLRILSAVYGFRLFGLRLCERNTRIRGLDPRWLPTGAYSDLSTRFHPEPE